MVGRRPDRLERRTPAGLPWLVLLALALPGLGPGSSAASAVSHASPTASAIGPLASAHSLASAPRYPPTPRDNWTSLTNYTSGAPSQRDQLQFAYDPALNTSVLFGGYLPTGEAEGDTWEFTNATWTQLNPATAPPARWGAGFTYDAKDGYLLLFGGRDASRYFNDTWAFNGSGWHNLTRAVAPPRLRTELTYDAADGYVVMDGGTWKNLTSGNAYLTNITWTYAGGRWTNITSTAGIAPSYARVVDDVADGYLLADDVATPGPNEVYTFSAGRWSLTPTVGTPSLGVQSADGTWDPATGFVLFFGAEENTPQENVTLAYRGGVWTNLTGDLGFGPPARGDAALAYDPTEGGVVVFGGDTPNNYTYWADTWLFRGVPYAASLTVFPSVLDLGASDHMTVTLSEQTGNFTYQYNATALPPGCPPVTTASWSCRPNATGVFALSVEVNRSDGAVEWANATVRIVPAPVVTIGALPSAIDVNESITFIASVTNGTAPFAYSWSFGDGRNATGARVTHSYSSGGNFTVRVNVSDQGGGAAGARATVDVAGRLGVAVTVSSREGDVGRSVSFHAMILGGSAPWSVNWSFGSGAYANGANASFAFPTAGGQTAICKVTDGAGLTVSDPVSILINPAPRLNATANVTTTDAGLSVSFLASISGGTGLSTIGWSFGDGGTAMGNRSGHAFTTGGRNYTVTATGTDALGAVSTGSAVVYVELDPIISASVPVLAADVGVAMRFTSSVAGGMGPYSVSWSFTDGQTAAGADVSVTFPDPGSITGTAQAIDARGFVDRTLVSFVIHPRVGASATIAAASGCAGAYSVAFTVNVTGGTGPFVASWSFGDNATTTRGAINVTHVYLTGGAFAAQVTVTDADDDSASSSINVPAAANCPGPASNGATPASPLGWELAGVIAIAAIALVSVAMVLLRRRRAPPQDPAGDDAPAPEAPDE